MSFFVLISLMVIFAAIISVIIMNYIVCPYIIDPLVDYIVCKVSKMIYKKECQKMNKKT